MAAIFMYKEIVNNRQSERKFFKKDRFPWEILFRNVRYYDIFLSKIVIIREDGRVCKLVSRKHDAYKVIKYYNNCYLELN